MLHAGTPLYAGEGRLLTSCACGLCWRCACVSHIHELLGEGAFGKVYRCTDSKDDHAEYAVKILNKKFLRKKRVGRFGNMLQTVQREVAIWKKLKHPHVVHLFEVINDPGHDHLYLINEYVPGGCVLPDEECVLCWAGCATIAYRARLLTERAAAGKLTPSPRNAFTSMRPSSLMGCRSYTLKRWAVCLCYALAARAACLTLHDALRLCIGT